MTDVLDFYDEERASHRNKLLKRLKIAQWLLVLIMVALGFIDTRLTFAVYTRTRILGDIAPRVLYGEALLTIIVSVPLSLLLAFIPIKLLPYPRRWLTWLLLVAVLVEAFIMWELVTYNWK